MLNDRALCSFESFSDSTGCFPVRALIKAEDCLVPPGSCFFIGAGEAETMEQEETGSETAKTETPPSSTHRSKKTAAFSETHKKAVAKETEVEKSPSEEQHEEDSSVQYTEKIGVPDNAIEDVKKLIPAGGDASIFTVLLAAIGVAGGGAAWKFYQQKIKLNHEARMKELELKASQSNVPESKDAHQKCAAERQALEMKIAALEEAFKNKFAEIEKAKLQGSSMDFDIDLDDWSDRLTKLEKTINSMKRNKSKAFTKKPSENTNGE